MLSDRNKLYVLCIDEEHQNLIRQKLEVLEALEEVVYLSLSDYRALHMNTLIAFKKGVEEEMKKQPWPVLLMAGQDIERLDARVLEAIKRFQEMNHRTPIIVEPGLVRPVMNLHSPEAPPLINLAYKDPYIDEFVTTKPYLKNTKSQFWDNTPQGKGQNFKQRTARNHKQRKKRG